MRGCILKTASRAPAQTDPTSPGAGSRRCSLQSTGRSAQTGLSQRRPPNMATASSSHSSRCYGFLWPRCIGLRYKYFLSPHLKNGWVGVDLYISTTGCIHRFAPHTLLRFLSLLFLKVTFTFHESASKLYFKTSNVLPRNARGERHSAKGRAAKHGFPCFFQTSFGHPLVGIFLRLHLATNGMFYC